MLSVLAMISCGICSCNFDHSIFNFHSLLREKFHRQNMLIENASLVLSTEENIFNTTQIWIYMYISILPYEYLLCRQYLRRGDLGSSDLVCNALGNFMLCFIRVIKLEHLENLFCVTIFYFFSPKRPDEDVFRKT